MSDDKVLSGNEASVPSGLQVFDGRHTPALTQAKAFANAVFNIAKSTGYDAEFSRLHTSQACHRVANKILQLIEGQYEGMPSFQLTPINKSDTPINELYWADDKGQQLSGNWNYNQPIVNPEGSSYSQLHAARYDEWRDNLQSASKDLFS